MGFNQWVEPAALSWAAIGAEKEEDWFCIITTTKK
jgi:hypothetical protein